MGTVSLAQVNDAIASTVSAATSAPNKLGITQSYNELSEGIPETPTVQVYPKHGDDHVDGQQVNRGTFGSAPLRARVWTFHIDVMAEQRGIIAQNMGEVVRMASLIEDVLDQQSSKPLFGLDGIQDFKFYWDYVTVVYGGNQYAGLRFVLGVWVY